MVCYYFHTYLEVASIPFSTLFLPLQAQKEKKERLPFPLSPPQYEALYYVKKLPNFLSPLLGEHVQLRTYGKK